SAVPDGLPDVQIDANRIGEVLVNLIHNALKYTPEEGEVTVRARTDCAPDRGREVVVEVADTGIGINEEDLGRVFERFFKVDRSRARQEEPHVAQSQDGSEHGGEDEGQAAHVLRLELSAAAGTGLGLAIAKHLVELQGGRIWAKSSVGRGSTFS